MKFGLVLTNISSSVKFYDHQAIAHNTMIIKTPDNNKAYYKVGPFQTIGGWHPVDIGEIVTLFENRNITDEYVIIKPGKYTIQFLGGYYGAAPDSNFPSSNVIEFEVKPRIPDGRDLLISSLINTLPDANWQAINTQKDKHPVGRREVESSSIILWHPIPNQKGGANATLWQTKIPAEVDKQAENELLSDYLGKNVSGYYYIVIDPKALEYWPKMKEDITKTLNLDTDGKIKDNYLLEMHPAGVGCYMFG